MKHLALSGTLLALIVAGCADQRGSTGNGVFNDPAKPSAQSIAEAKQVDDVQALINDGLFDRARTALDRLIADGSRQPQVMYLKARLTRQAGDLEGAIPWANKACEASPQWIEPRILLAQIYLKLERWTAAASVFSDIERLAPHGPWGPYGQGAVAATRGDFAAAGAFCDTALSRDPDHLPSLTLRAQTARIQGDAVRENELLTRIAALAPEDADVRLRLGELAQSAGRLEDARRHLSRAYELEPRPTTAQKLANLARLLNDPQSEQRWLILSGARPAADAPPAEPIR